MKLFLSVLIFLIPITVLSQEFKDIIVMNTGDTVKCKITLINDQSIFYDHKVKKSIENTFASISDIKYYKQEGSSERDKQNMITSRGANSDTSDYSQNQFFYCEIIVTKWPLRSAVEVQIDWGETAGQTGYIRDGNGKVITFTNTIDALNYMGKRGWELVSSYTVKIDMAEVSHYLLKKFVTKN